MFTAAGDRVPGPRSFALIEPVQFPWRAAIDAIEEVGSQDSFRTSMDLSRAGLICGPSSGFNYTGTFPHSQHRYTYQPNHAIGLCQFLSKRKAAGTLSELAGPNGEIKCVFLCCDLPYQYIPDYFEKLDTTYFPSITNEHLTKVDLYNNYYTLEQEARISTLR